MATEAINQTECIIPSYGFVGDNGDKIECIACHGSGYLSRAETLKTLGGNNILGLLEMSEHEFFVQLEKNSPRIISEIKSTLDEKNKEMYLSIENRYNYEVQRLKEAHLKLQIDLDNERNAKMALETKQQCVPSLKGNTGEKNFEEWIRGYAQFECSEKLSKSGDFICKLKKFLPNGNLEVIENSVLVDSKRDLKINNEDINKLIRDAKLRSIKFAYMIVNNREQFRAEDVKQRVIEKDEVLLFKGDYNNFLEDMAFLPYFMTLKQESSENYKIKAESLRKIILQKMYELDEFKNLASSIIREASKINSLVDGKKQSILDELNRILIDN